ncbi:BRO-N domain-containing protein, partial [Lactobacillus jensenii]|uniref:BRO-N domain-containing protein n=1 Tax=Lactobacillus jensenii TaxID=109790 RepID=UPI00286FDD91
MNKVNNLQIFSLNGLDVRTVLIDGAQYFVGKDIAEIFGYAKSRNAIKNHLDDE